MFKLMLSVVASLSLFHPQSASAQIVPPGALTLGGFPVTCGSVPTSFELIGDIAQARPGWIILHPNILNLPTVVQVFIYAHECGHHNVGANDAAADCWAIRVGRNQGWFAAADINWLVAYFGHSTGDFSHAPGPARIGQMVRCFSS